MAETPKDTPDPIEEPESLRSGLERVADGKPDRSFEISMIVTGGAPSQRYSFEFAAKGTGTASTRMSDEKSDRRGVSDQRFEASELADLARNILQSGVLDTATDPPRFLPDTLVGILDIKYGTSRLRHYFAADAEQARVQDAVPPAAVTKAAEAIYAVGARRMSKRSVKP